MRIASVPSSHPYVEAVLPALAGRDEAPLVRLPDPTPPGETPGSGVWWPPAVVDARWIRSHASRIDVVHTHFGLESFAPAHLAAFVDALDAEGIPLVHTVHDLENPHLADQAAHLAGLDVVVPRAAALLTLTDAAADAVQARWGRRPQVVPHPRIVPERWFARADAVRAGAGTGRVGMHLGAVRASTDPTGWLPTLADAVRGHGRELVVRVNDEVVRSGSEHARRVLDAVRAEAARGRLVLEESPRPGDDELHAWVARLDVCVLPYRAGTHSGWLEMCWDLGTSVLVPDVGAILDQHDDPAFRQGFVRAQPAGIEPALAALLAARTGGVPWGDGQARWAAREDELAAVRAAHAAVYERVRARA